MGLRIVCLKAFVALSGFISVIHASRALPMTPQKRHWKEFNHRSSTSGLLNILKRAEQSYGIPKHLLAAIALSESGRLQNGQMHPWPWTINVEGKGYFFPSKSAAIQKVRWFQSRGVRSIDVGPMQINLLHHPNAFRSLEEAFDPSKNIQYAAEFLCQLSQAQQGRWRVAVAHYHSMNPSYHIPYREKVLRLWEGMKRRSEREPFRFNPRRPLPTIQYAHLEVDDSKEAFQMTANDRLERNDEGLDGVSRTPSLRHFKTWKLFSARAVKKSDIHLRTQKMKHPMMAHPQRAAPPPPQVQRIDSLRTAYWAVTPHLRPRMTQVGSS